MVWFKHSLLIFVSSILFACGGDGSVDLSGGGSSGGDGGTSSSTTASIGIALYTCADGINTALIPQGCVKTNTVPSDTDTYVVVTLSNASAIANELVSLSTVVLNLKQPPF
ncbi:hypothetical protein [Agarivorans sp. QJM3NY_25]|uniref:hypothetical protein n=1 Tax=Agarivorans sp. QJM3NY_25 TaxID=3421430 RepID=UPI003D7C8153